MLGRTMLAVGGAVVTAAGAYLYVVKSGSAPMKFDDDHTVPIRGKESDGFLAKYSCEDGTGQWIQSIGGQGSDTLTDVVTTPNGVLVAGYSKSSEVSLAGVTIANLQHQRASAADGTSNPSAGHQAHFAMMIHAEERLSCLKNCPSGSTTDAEVKEDFCVADGTCMSKGAPPPAFMGSASSCGAYSLGTVSWAGVVLYCAVCKA